MLDFLKLRTGIEAVGEQSRKLALAVEKAKQEREQLETAPLPRDQFADQLCQMVDAQAVAYQESFQQIVGSLIHRPDFDPLTSRLDILAGHGGGGGTIPPRNAAFFFRDIIKQRTRDAVGDMDYPDEVGPPLADRPAALAKLDAKIAKLEAEEAEIRDAAHAAGIDLAGVAVQPKKV